MGDEGRPPGPLLSHVTCSQWPCPSRGPTGWLAGLSAAQVPGRLALPSAARGCGGGSGSEVLVHHGGVGVAGTRGSSVDTPMAWHFLWCLCSHLGGLQQACWSPVSCVSPPCPAALHSWDPLGLGWLLQAEPLAPQSHHPGVGAPSLTGSCKAVAAGRLSQAGGQQGAPQGPAHDWLGGGGRCRGQRRWSHFRPRHL